MCAGTGHPVAARGSGVERDYATVCPTCGGTGYVETPSSAAGPSARSASASGGSTRRGGGAGARGGGSGVTLKGLFGLGGLVGGVAVGVHLFPGNGVAILITAVICAVLAAMLYKLAIGLALVVVVGAAVLQGSKDNGTASEPAAKSAALSADRVPSPNRAVEPAAVPNKFQVASPQPMAVNSSVACVRVAYAQLLGLFKQLRDSNLSSGAERLSKHSNLYTRLLIIDVSQCPSDYQTAHRQLVHNVGASLKVAQRTSTGYVVSNAEYDAASNAVGRSIDTIVEVAERHVPGSRKQAAP
jgi:hypothetical protein